MTRRLVWGALAVMMGGLAVWLFWAERPLTVPVAQAQPNAVVRVYGLGTVEARILSDIGFEVGAGLLDLAVDSGDKVVKGQPLAQLHAAEQSARAARAQAGVAAAQANLGKARANTTRASAVLAQRRAANIRQQALAGRSVASAQAAEAAQRDVDVAQAELSVAQSDVSVAQALLRDAEAAQELERVLLRHHTLFAPYDGVIVTRHVEAGTVVGAGQPIFTVMDPATVWVLAFVDEERAGALALGQPAQIRLRSLPHQVFTGSVARIGLESDRVNEERRVWVACDHCPAQVYLGEQAEIHITVAQLTDVILVPDTAISSFDGHQGRIWIADQGRARQVGAVFGHRTEDARVALVSDLPKQAQVITHPPAALTDGRLLRPTDEVTR